MERLQSMFKDWTRFEKIWFAAFSLIILAVTLIFSSMYTDWSSWQSILLNWVISPLSAWTGIICVVLVAKGHISNYTWGFVNALTYGYIAYMSGYYGDMVLNWFYFLPFQFIGYYWWKKHLKPASKKYVKIRKLTLRQAVSVIVAGIAATAIIGWALGNLDHWFVEIMKRNVSIYTYFDQTFGVTYLGALLDSSTEVLQIIAQILMTLAFAEQWILWILTNVISIFMWGTVVVADPSSLAWALPTLVMWIAYLVNSIYGWINWKKEAGKAE